ncbi:hypothetical protein Krac_0496 [Ktedonobacter racemifer DSM 44963]|uniref:Uncharacterized protein n=1 Tax=Ktedonobacter racemifer DSM 44963 TaxID=485913 RepID=D6U7V3_KTERA|nr:hypothetical protein Krac_0496 [Ktedonobacter racemifer DSM 44963]
MTQKATASVLDAVLQGQRLSDAEARSLVDWGDVIHGVW